MHGEAGAGKTRLVTAATDEARADGATVLWGRCLRFGAASSPYLPFVSALQRWLAEGHDTAELDLEQLGTPDGAAEVPGRALHLIDRSLGRLAAAAPVVLVVDDLQWADVSSLDALAFLIAGALPRRLALLVTYRDEGLSEGHVLHEWLADMVRMPGVTDLPLRALDREETTEQLELLLGGPVSSELVEDVWGRSGGNAYLTELLARDVDPRTERLPADLPDALRTALLARWHSLSGPARRLAQVLAVAGRPATPAVLAAVAGRGPVDEPVREAVVAGVLRRDADDRVWFRHPLLSDVLDETLLEDEARALHAQFVDVLLAQGADDTRTHADLALHYVGAGRPDAAFEHCLIAAREARAGAAYPEAGVLLRKAVELWPQVSEDVREAHGSLPALLADAAWVCRSVGEFPAGVDLLEQALPLLDDRTDPSTAALVLRLRAQMRWTAGLTPAVELDVVQRAVDVSRVPGAEEQHALALADLADCRLWRGDAEAALRDAEEAVALARRIGDTAVLSYTLSTLANARLEHDDAEALAREAVAVGLTAPAESSEYAALAVISLFNVLDTRGRFEEAADVLVDAHRRGPTTSGLTHLLGVYAASALIPLGRLDEARELLRTSLAFRARGIFGIQAREYAAVVALRQGDLAEATTHLARARELAEHFEEQVGLHGPGVQAEHLLTLGRPREVLGLLERTIEKHSRVEPKYGDSLLLWALRAAAALPRREGEPLLDRVLAARDRAPVPRFAGEDTDPGQRAVHALFDAELARCRADSDVVERWRAAVTSADAASLRYVATEARLRLAEALLGAHARAEAAPVLREAHELAATMAAWRLRDEVAAVAAAGRVPLERPAARSAPSTAARQHGLTARETEILSHLVAGRTYAEIAAALVISEKTVSVHVSNLLRKTGTSSRVEAAAWARRNGAVAG